VSLVSSSQVTVGIVKSSFFFVSSQIVGSLTWFEFFRSRIPFENARRTLAPFRITLFSNSIVFYRIYSLKEFSLTGRHNANCLLINAILIYNRFNLIENGHLFFSFKKVFVPIHPLKKDHSWFGHRCIR